MYKDLIENLKEECNKLRNFSDGFLKDYIKQKEDFKTDIIDIIDTIIFNKNFAQAKADSVRAFYGEKVGDVFKAEVDYYDEAIKEFKIIKEEVEELQDFKVNFITNNKESLNKFLENEEIEKLAKMIIIESEKENGCMFHFNDVYKTFYQYTCSVCDETILDEDGENEYIVPHFMQLSPEEVIKYAEETIEKD